MKNRVSHLRSCGGHRSGAMLVLIAITLPLILAMAAFAVDIAWMQLVRTELRTATDSASRAGTKALNLHQTEAAARAAAKEAASRNIVAGTPLLVQDSEIEIGFGSQANGSSRFNFTAGGRPLNAVRVTGSRTGASAGGSVQLFLGKVLGVTEFQPSHIAASTQLDRDICLVVDRSGSMMTYFDGTYPSDRCAAPHATQSRWGALRSAVDGFVSELEATVQFEQCALASYSSANTNCGIVYNTSDINSDLDTNYQPIRDEMNRLSSRAVRGRTNISSGIDNGIVVLTGPRSRPFALRTMVVMTDGLHNTGPEPVLSAQRAALENITIHTVTFSSEADLVRMRAVANATGGNHYHAPDAAALVQIFREIAATLPVMITE